MKDFWNQRYAASAYAYGTEPNAFFKAMLDALAPGRILLPAEGEGRNAVYAARRGWEVTAFDISEAGRDKALKLAAGRGVAINYLIGDFPEAALSAGGFDAVALIFAHFPEIRRQDFHQRLAQLLARGGRVILEGFSREHLAFSAENPEAGGPKDPAMLFDNAMLEADFSSLETQLLETREVVLDEGLYHRGLSSVVRYVGRRPAERRD